MPYVIALPRVDVLDRACVEECPVDCIYESDRSLYIHPDECADCGAGEPVCPVEAIDYDDLPEQRLPHLQDNERFFTDRLTARDGALERAPVTPSGRGRLRPVGRPNGDPPMPDGKSRCATAPSLGLMQGALAQLGGPVTVDRLEPSAEPDLCVAHLSPADGS